MTPVLFLTPRHFPDYELIDCGNFEKLERFGKYILIRPEPQAVWSKQLSEKEWSKLAHVRFKQRSSSSGTWEKMKEMPERWMIEFGVKMAEVNQTSSGYRTTLTFKLALTSFKHVGIFPEQAVNWDYIYECIVHAKRKENSSEIKVLNLFAYTGAASLVAKAAGADVTHLDSVKQVVSWARENMALSNLNDIRWVVEDAMTYVKREVKRGKKYHGIILDPPAYGHGTDGKSWKLEDNILEMMKSVKQLLNERNHFLLLNVYSLGFSPLIIENLFRELYPSGEKFETGEIYLGSREGQKLPLGVFGRCCKTA
jgi:23S rRNA (cytosine1962-C5)-methyltransferase